MLKARSTRVHRHTRPSAYMDQSRQARQQRAQRPGSSGFSFTGEFPEVIDPTPVEAPSRRRQYTASAVDTGAYQAVGGADTERMPVVSRYGVQFRTAVVMCFAFFVLLGGIWLMDNAETTAAAKRVSMQQQRIQDLSAANADAEKKIAEKADDISIRREAVRLGLINSKGVSVIYLTAPETPDITPAHAASAQMLIASSGQ